MWQLEPQRFVVDGWLKKFLIFLLSCLDGARLEFPSPATTTTLSVNPAAVAVLVDPSARTCVDPAVTFSALGDLISAVQHHITPMVDTLLPYLVNFPESAFGVAGVCSDCHAISADLTRLVKQACGTTMMQRAFLGTPSKTISKEAFTCLIKLLKAVGPAMVDYMPAVIGRMCSGGVSASWFIGVEQIAETIPSASHIIQARIVHFLTEPLKPFGSRGDSGNREVLGRMALAALGRLGVDDPVLRRFVVECIFRYLEEGSNSELRCQAALTACKIMLPKAGHMFDTPPADTKNRKPDAAVPLQSGCDGGSDYQADDDAAVALNRFMFHGDPAPDARREAEMPVGWSYTVTQKQATWIQQAVGRLLCYIVAETDAVGRAVVLEALSAKFDPFLLQPARTIVLAQLLYDSDLGVRRAALQIFARLTAARHTVILQLLDQLTIELLTMLESDFPWTSRAEASILLADLAEVATFVIQPYGFALLNRLFRKLKEALAVVESTRFRAVLTSPAAATDYRPASREWPTEVSLIPPSTSTIPQPSTDGSSCRRRSTTTGTSAYGTASESTEVLGSTRAQQQQHLPDQIPVPLSYIRSLLRVVGALCTVVSPQDLDDGIRIAMDVLVAYLLYDSTGSLWLVDALNAVTALLANSRHPVRTCRAYPLLLPFLLQVVQSMPPGMDVSPAALRCIGALGAIDPSQYVEITAAGGRGTQNRQINSALRAKYKTFLSTGRLGRPVRSQMMQRGRLPAAVDEHHQDGGLALAESTSTDGEVDISPGTPTSPNEEDEGEVDLFSRHIVVELLKLLEDIGQPATVKGIVMRALFRVLLALKKHAAHFVPLAVPCLLTILEQSTDPCHRTQILQHMQCWIGECGRAFRPFLTSLFEMVGHLVDGIAASLDAMCGDTPSPGAGAPQANYRRSGSLCPPEDFSRRPSYERLSCGGAARDAALSGSAELGWSGAMPALCSTDPLLSEMRAALGIVDAVFRTTRQAAVSFAQTMLSRFVRILRSDQTPDRAMSCCVLEALDGFGNALAENTYLLVPQLLPLLSTGSPIALKAAVLRALRSLALYGDLSLFIPGVGRTLCLMLRDVPSDLVQPIAVTLKLLRKGYPNDFQHLVPLLRRVAIDRGYLPSHQNDIEDVFASFFREAPGPDCRSGGSTPNLLGVTLLSSVFGRRLFSRTLTPLPTDENYVSPGNPHRGGPVTPAAVPPPPTRVVCPDGECCLRRPDGDLDISPSPILVEHWSGEANLRRVWHVGSGASTEDIAQWLRQLTGEMIKESPMFSIRACAPVTQYGSTLSFGRDIFPMAFLSCWLYLSDSGKLNLTEAVSNVLGSPNTSLPDLHQVLNLVEAMALQGESLLIDLDVLARVTERCHAYAKAVRYRELDWDTRQEACVEPLIGLYYSLQQTDAALGVLNYAKKHFNTPLKESWNEKLRKWRVALTAYELQQLNHPESVEWLKGRMRCLYALGHWDQVSFAAAAAWDKEDAEFRDRRHRAEIASVAAAAELNLRNYDRMHLYVEYLQTGETHGSETGTTRQDADETPDAEGHPFESSFFGAILKIQSGQFAVARRLLDLARAALAVELTALLGESYTRAYRALVKVQQLFEVEEVMLYKEVPEDSPRRKQIQEVWAERLLEGCQADTEVWHSILQVRGIVLPPREDVPIWLKFAAQSRKQERFGIASRVVEDLCNPAYASSQDPRVSAAHIKNIYAFGEAQRARELLKTFCGSIASALKLVTADKTMPLLSLMNVCRRFPMGELRNLQRQMERLHDDVSPALRRRLLSPTRIRTLAAAKLLGTLPSVATLQHFGSLGLTPLELELLTAKNFTKLATWTLQHYEAQAPATCGGAAPFTPWLDPNVPYGRVANGSNLGGWCHAPDALREVIAAQRIAVQLCPELSKVWKGWAEVNFHLSQAVDMSRRHRRQLFSASRFRREGTATLSLETCPLLCQLEQEMGSLKKAWSYASCRCVCHERSPPPPRSAVLQAIAAARRSVCAQVRQHLVFVVEAAGGFIRSIGLKAQNESIQSSLRLLAVWFRVRFFLSR